MRLAAVAAVALLFVLVPHQGPFAGPAEGDAPASDRLATEGSEPQPAATTLADEGFVWSRAFDPSSGDGWTPGAPHLETDGYAWSTRAAESFSAAEPTSAKERLQ